MTNTDEQFPSWVFMGSPQIAVDFLESLYENYELLPTAVVTNPPKAVGRKHTVTPTPVALFAQKHNIPCHTPTGPDHIVEILEHSDIACVFAYGSILPTQVLEAPRYGCVNIHPSLLPTYRGPSPITTAILDDEKQTGVTLMKLVSKMDAGPIIAQSPVTIEEWDKYHIHEQELAEVGARLFHDYTGDYVRGSLFPQEQSHAHASYCPKYSKQDMELDPSLDDYSLYRRYCAFPKPFFTSDKRYVVTQAHYHNGCFTIDRVTPEGKTERDFRTEDWKERYK